MPVPSRQITPNSLKASTTAATLGIAAMTDGLASGTVFAQRGPQQRRIDTGVGTIETSALSPDGKHLTFIETRAGHGAGRPTS